MSQYILKDDFVADMPRNAAHIENTLKVRHLSYNRDGKKFGCIYFDESLSRSKIPNLRE